MKTWEISDSLKTYCIENWGAQYFNINPAGNLTVHPRQGAGPGVDITRVVSDVRKRGLELPVLIRFQDIIRHRVVFLNETFKRIIQESGFKGQYRGVYPIKVNQMREVVEEIVDAGAPYNFGLEAGSKAELTAVMAAETSPGALLICNGYKDYQYIKTAMLGRKLGRPVFVVVEKLSELEHVIEISEEMKVKPLIGIRLKLSARGSGKWESSAGDGAKFGLTTPELIYAVNFLKRKGLEDCFKLLHFHIGSQITDIRTIKNAVREATRFYSKIQKMEGFELQYLDVGGGLGVDYDGSQTNFDSSINYTLEEYVADIVYTIQEVCQVEGVPEPDIVSESGRALVAHHSVLIVDVFGSIEIGKTPPGFKETSAMDETEDEAEVVKEMRYIQKNVSHKNLLESFHDALQFKEQALNMFNLGMISLEDRAKAEYLFWKACRKIHKYSKHLKYITEELENLGKRLADQYLCNFSLFQSLADHWAIQHLFPIVPIHRLDEQPVRNSTLVDITCDSDGKICKFIDLKDINDTLPVHELKKNEPYYLGFFLMGAYQDIMGDIHNLFGRVNEVHVFLDETEPGGYYIEEVIRGNTVNEVLALTQYSDSFLKKSLKQQIDARVREGEIKPREGVELQNFYEDVLKSYTYVDARRAGQEIQSVGKRLEPQPVPPESGERGFSPQVSL